MTDIQLDGADFHDLATFYDEVERTFTRGLNWHIGRNLDAFNDVLRGGFGIHGYEQPISITWLNSGKSRNDLGQKATVDYPTRN